jgi:hypothetical protein
VNGGRIFCILSVNQPKSVCGTFIIRKKEDNLMKITVLTLLCIFAATIVLSGEKPETVKNTPAFDKLKSLEGTWRGKDEKGTPITISYKIVSAGSTVMETLDMGEKEGTMVTMYHPDGDKLMMTHYCSMGNQPRMRAQGLSNDGMTISFKFVDATNLSSPGGDCMRKLVLMFKDGDHFSQEWTMRMGGKNQAPDKFEFERMK